eukprot:COSAG02_NODE_134_length_34593_cov_43.594886_12_plen_75_part_00
MVRSVINAGVDLRATHGENRVRSGTWTELVLLGEQQEEGGEAVGWLAGWATLGCRSMGMTRGGRWRKGWPAAEG